MVSVRGSVKFGRKQRIIGHRFWLWIPIFTAQECNPVIYRECCTVNLDAVLNSSIFTPLQFSDGVSHRDLAVFQKCSDRVKFAFGQVDQKLLSQ